MTNETEELIARANAAMAEAARLIEANLLWQARAHALLRRMSFRASFQPKYFTLYYRPDLPDQPSGGNDAN